MANDRTPFITSERQSSWRLLWDLPRLATDDKYLEVAACLGIDPATFKDSLLIEIMTDAYRFPCSESPTGWCAGRYFVSRGLIQVVESQSALAPELAHHLTQDFTHPSDDLIHECGDAVDGALNHQVGISCTDESCQTALDESNPHDVVLAPHG